MMADGALRATERQFRRLLNSPSIPGPVDLEIFSLPELERTPEARKYIDENYLTFDQIRHRGLDALIITGVNLSDPRLETQAFWKPLIRVMDWSGREVVSTLCSCLATHAVLQFKCGQKRQPMGQKLWGVFPQTVANPRHRLTRGVPPVLQVPHSRHNDVTAKQFEAAGWEILVADANAGVHLTVHEDLSLVAMQGHPEYDTVSLLKEYKREVNQFRTGVRKDYPPVPENYFAPEGLALMVSHRRQVAAAVKAGQAGPEFPETQVQPFLINDWSEPTALIFANWLGLVAELKGRAPGC